MAASLRGAGLKLLTIGIGAVFALTILAVVPRGTSQLTVLGRRTLQVYILHRLIRAWLTFCTPFYDMPVLLDPLWGTVIIVLITAVVITVTGARRIEPLMARARKLPWCTWIANARRVFMRRDGR